MIPPLQALLIAGPDAQCAVDEGRKFISIRNGMRNFRVGEPIVLYCNVTKWCAMGHVTHVDYYRAGAIPDRDARDDGFGSSADALVGMRRLYPSLTPESFVTVIRWRLE